MKKTPLRRVSEKQKKELALRKQIKAELIEENGALCMTCGTHQYYLDLSHILALSKGGKTERGNVILECRRCHQIRHHQIVEKNTACLYPEWIQEWEKEE